jgi:hypothetical protein
MATIIILAFLISLVAGMHVVEVTKADPFWIFKHIDPIPGTIPPTITIFSPQNNTVYSSDTITVSFKVSKPQLTTWESSINEIEYTVDCRQTIQLFSIYNQEVNNNNGIPEFNTTFTLPSLSTGDHSLTVKASGTVLNTNPLEVFFINSSSTTFFTVGTQPTLQPSPTPSSHSIASDYWLNPRFLISIISVIVVVVVVASISLVYFKKRKR